MSRKQSDSTGQLHETGSKGGRLRSLGPKLTKAQVAAYLERIGYGGSTTRTGDTLRELHFAHMFNVPFENLDISLGRYIKLDIVSLFHKIVTERRGGFCYELNGLFGALLRTLGFRVDQLSAGVAGLDGSFSPPFDHLTLLVGAGDGWLVDVGFGDSFLAPLPLALGGDGFLDLAGKFRLISQNKYIVLQTMTDEGEWKPSYRFTYTHYSLKAFTERCHFQQTSPESHFTRKRICSLARPDGRVTLSDHKLIETVGTKRTERLLNSDTEIDSVLENLFGVVLFPTGAAVH